MIIHVARDLKLVPIDSLKPYEKNARTHSEEQIAQIAASMREWGFTNPILIDGDKGIIAGHGRLAAAKEIGLTEVPIIELAHLTPAQKRAYIIADNKLALNAGWDDALLAEELAALADEDFNIDLLGFSDEELADLLPDDPEEMSEGSGEGEDRELTETETETLNEAWRTWSGEVIAALERLNPHGMVDVGINRGTAKILFLRALFYGDDFPRYASIAYHPHRLKVAGDKGSLHDILTLVQSEASVAERLRWALNEKPDWKMLLSMGMALRGCRQPLDFPASLAKDLINEFCPFGGAVLDPCHGWGGRATGFLLSHASSYHGFDPSPETFVGVRNLISDFAKYTDKKAHTEMVCFEDAVLTDQSYDFALTSPPYFDVEKYTGEQSSHARYQNFDAWNVSFYGVMIRKVANALRPGSVFALQIGNQTYPLEAAAKDHAKNCGLEYIGTRHSGMVNTQSDKEESDGEVIVLFKKVQ